MRTKLKGTQNKHNNSLIETENEEEENFLNQKEIKMTVQVTGWKKITAKRIR